MWVRDICYYCKHLNEHNFNLGVNNFCSCESKIKKLVDDYTSKHSTAGPALDEAKRYFFDEEPSNFLLQAAVGRIYSLYCRETMEAKKVMEEEKQKKLDEEANQHYRQEEPLSWGYGTIDRPWEY